MGEVMGEVAGEVGLLRERGGRVWEVSSRRPGEYGWGDPLVFSAALWPIAC